MCRGRRLALLVTFVTLAQARGPRAFSRFDLCRYWQLVGRLDEHPECVRSIDTTPAPNTPAPLQVCTGSSSLVQCTSDAMACPQSGQVCTQSDGNRCCQTVSAGIPVSHINAKAGDCPAPLGISVLQDTNIGCWLDTNCPGIQKCCVEPNAVTNSATRICRDPVGISSTSLCNLPIAVGTCTAPTTRYYYDSATGQCNSFQYSGCGGNPNNFATLASCQSTCGSFGITGTPACPADANAGLNCLFAHADACHTDSDCLGRENTVQPSCCLTTCGYKICHAY